MTTTVTVTKCYTVVVEHLSTPLGNQKIKKPLTHPMPDQQTGRASNNMDLVVSRLVLK
jgi:hypothetical protein